MSFMIITNLLIKIIKVLICLIPLSPLIVSESTIFPFIVGKAIYSRILIEFIFGLWIILIFLDKTYRPKLSIVFLSLIIYLIIVFIASLFGVSFVRSFWSTYERMQGIFDLIHWIVLILVIVSVYKDWKDYKKLFIVNSVVSIIVCSEIFHTYENIVFLKDTIGNPSYKAQYCMINLFLVGLLLVKEYQYNHRIISWVNLFYITVILLNLIILWFAGSRAIFVSLFISLFALSTMYLFVKNTKIIKYFAYCTVSLLLFSLLVAFIVLKFDFIVSDDTSVNQLNYVVVKLRNISTDNGNQQRIVTINASIDAFYDRPILGWGPENYIAAWGSNITSETLEVFDTPHNKLLETLNTSGILGLMSYILIWILLCLVIITALIKTKYYEQFCISVLGVALLSFLVSILFLFNTTIGIMHLSLLIALSISYEYKFNVFFNIKKYLFKIHLSSCMDINNIKIFSIVFASLFMVLIVFVPIKQFSGAQYMLLGVVSSDLNDKIYYYEKSSKAFKYLDTYPMTYLIKDITKNILPYIKYEENGQTKINNDKLNQFGVFIDDASYKITEKEPYNFIVYFTIATAYIYLSQFDNQYFSNATFYKDQAVQLAPNYPKTQKLIDFHNSIEDKLIK